MIKQKAGSWFLYNPLSVRLSLLIKKLKDFLVMKTTARYTCGCPVGTPAIWRRKNGLFTAPHDINAATVQCCGCKKSERINESP